jgi:hypothetical protein
MERKSSREAMEGSRTVVDVEALTLEAGGQAGAGHRCPRTTDDGHDRCIVGDGCWTPSWRGEALLFGSSYSN